MRSPVAYEMHNPEIPVIDISTKSFITLLNSERIEVLSSGRCAVGGWLVVARFPTRLKPCVLCAFSYYFEVQRFAQRVLYEFRNLQPKLEVWRLTEDDNQLYEMGY